ncbi:MAG: uroporphyrinogen decarboxylase family protein [Nitrososphaerales archaeon]
MNSKERLARAIAGQPTDVPAVAPAYLSLYLDETSQRFYRQAYERKLFETTGLRSGAVYIDPDEDARFRAEAVLRAYDTIGEQPDWIHTHPAETRAWAERGEMRFSEGRWLYVDRQSGETMDMDEPSLLPLPSATRYSYPAQTSTTDVWDTSVGLNNPADIDRLVPIRSTGELAADGAFKVTEKLASMAGDRMPLSVIAPTPFWSTYGLLGFQGMMVMMREKPELFTYLMERRARQRMERLRGHAAAGVKYVWMEECLSSADLISPADYERFAFATAGPYVAEVKKLGLTVILYYCGDVLPRLPWLKRLGMDALAVEESKKGFSIDIADVIAKVGDACCIFGNVDSVRVIFEGSRETIEAEVQRQLRLGQQARGFVLCQGSPFTLDTPPEKIGWFIAGARRWRARSFNLQPSTFNRHRSQP